MAFSLLLKAIWLLLLANFASARFARDMPLLNTTTSAIEDATTTPDESTYWKGHVESTASITVLAPDDTPTPTHKVIRVTSTPGDIGDIISSALDSTDVLTNSLGKIRIESSETGWGASPTEVSGRGGRVKTTVTPGPTAEPEESYTWDGVWPTESHDNWRPHMESSASGLNADQPVTDSEPTTTPPPTLPTVTFHSRVYTPIPKTSVEVGDKTLAPGGETFTYGEGPSATKVFVETGGNPVVVVGESTSTYQAPVTVGDKTGHAVPSGGLVIDRQTLTQGGSPITVDTSSGPTTLSIDQTGQTVAIANGETKTYEAPATQAIAIGEITATAVSNNNQYVVGSSTLTVGQTITSDGVVIALTTDVTGATVLVEGGTTATLAPPSEGIHIATTVISGTTEYIVGSQTLAPGHPVTVNGVPMDITTSAGATILVVGNLTTTITGSPSSTFRTGFGGTGVAVATPVDTSAAPSATETGKKGDAGYGKKRWSIWAIGGVAMLVGMVGYG